MKRNSFRKNNKFIGGIISLIALVSIVFFLNIFQTKIRGVFYWFSSPIQKNLWTAGVQTSNFFQGLSNFASLENKLEESERRNQGLATEIIRLREIEQENERLRTALNIGIEKDFDLAFAQIISKDASEDIILIDKGFEDGLLKDMAVITEEKVLIGRITEVFDKYSKIMLATHKNMSFDVMIKREGEEVSAVAQGQGSSKIIINLIPQKEEISEGDAIVTSNLGGIFPELILVGYIKEFAKNDTDPFQTARVDNALDISQIKNVFIIK